MRALILLLPLLVPYCALAGPWSRGEGKYFSVVGGNVALFQSERPIHYDPTFYSEYGLTHRVTVGVEGYSADKGFAKTELAFIRVPLVPEETLAVSLAFGAIQLGDSSAPLHWSYLLRAGLHWGIGLEQGWVTVDLSYLDDILFESSATLPLYTTFRQPKLDATWGHNFSDDWQGMLQFQAGWGLYDDFYAKFSPSVARRLSDQFRLRVGYTQAMTGDFGGAIGMELWADF